MVDGQLFKDFACEISFNILCELLHKTANWHNRKRQTALMACYNVYTLSKINNTMNTQRFYRIASAKYRFDLTGKGAELMGGRFNSVGTPAVYAATSISLATLEMLVHASQLYPVSHYIMAVDIPAACLAMTKSFLGSELPTGWDNLKDLSVAQKFGHKQLFDTGVLGVFVPSVIVPEQQNLILNPRHIDMSMVQISEIRALNLDPRLIK